ncbi:hypothetical protein NQ318_011996 [Aromia moschata]|uniref:Transposase n=1 Tax=Aromia moschata TaxID=1265417 RepID=A0AAV8XIH3_9CUCU|nr:hypothetical protein NQ318_011996 [Aromia moschata]
MINYHIVEEFLDNLPLNERRHVFFQQDGAPPHNTNLISELLNTNFGEKWIGNNGPHYFGWQKLQTNLIDTIGKGKSLSFKICPLKMFLSRIGAVLRHRRAICFEWHSGPKRSTVDDLKSSDIWMAPVKKIHLKNPENEALQKLRLDI